MSELKRRIEVAAGDKPASTVFKGGKILDVFNGTLIDADLAVDKGLIIGFGDYSGYNEIDVSGKILVPALIDSHVHIESSMMNPYEFSRALIAGGVGTAIADPHEIANVCGLKGIDYMLEYASKLPLDIRIMLPSCVPCTEFEHSGAVLGFCELAERMEEPDVLGLGEMMNFVGVVNCDTDVLEKLEGFVNMPIDGHAPGLKGKALNAYAVSGIKTDHECSVPEELHDRVARGMYVMIREGSAAKNLRSLIEGVNKNNISRILMCTDDKHPEDLLRDGSVDYNVRLAVSCGMDPVDAIRIASFNAASAYGLKGKGALAPGYSADIVVLDELETFKVRDVYLAGKNYVKDGAVVNMEPPVCSISLLDSVKIYPFSEVDLKIPLSSEYINVIEIMPNQLITNMVRVKARIEDGFYAGGDDLCKLAVIERHRGLKSMGLGVIKGMGLKGGAMASTIAHDSHNLIVMGDDDSDMICAAKEIKRIGGGFAIASGGKILKSVALEIGGLMSNCSLEEMNAKISEINKIAHETMGIKKEVDPIISLGFMALPVIPHIKLTDKGLFNVDDFKFIDIQC